MLYSKNGSIPTTETDGTDGWQVVPDMPEPPLGKEVVWWYPPGWVIRDPQPEPVPGYVWKWNQEQELWVSYQVPVISDQGTQPDVPQDPVEENNTEPLSP
jgi:hypothetical protein